MDKQMCQMASTIDTISWLSELLTFSFLMCIDIVQVNLGLFSPW